MQVAEHLKNFIDECDRKTEMAKRRLKETQEELSDEGTAKVLNFDWLLHYNKQILKYDSKEYTPRII